MTAYESGNQHENQLSQDYQNSNTPADRLAQLTSRTLLAEQMINASIDCVVALDTDGRVMQWNEACCQLSGVKAEAIRGGRFTDFFPSLGQHEVLKEAFIQVREGRKVFLPAEENVWFPGYFELHLVPLKSTDGAVNGIMLIAHEVAHRVKAEQALKRLNAMLEEKYTELERANAELATFTYITSHGLKEPLRTIYSHLERTIIDEGAKLSSNGRGRIRKVQATAQRLALLADSLATFSQLEAGPKEMLSMTAIVKAATAQLAPQINEQKAAVVIDTLPEMKGDPKQLTTMFHQLLASALKTRTGFAKPEIKVAAQKIPKGQLPDIPGLKKGQEYWQISIDSDGVEDRAGEEARMFSHFRALSLNESYAGNGVGLALANKIATNHNGALSVAILPEGPSAYRCFLPVMP